MGKKIKYNSQKLKSQKDMLIDREVAYVDIIMDKIKEGAVKAYSLNIYITEVAKFYREIMQTGLLRKIRGLHFTKKSAAEVERQQQAILEESKKTQRLIREKVR